MATQRTYLDYNATAPLLPQAAEAMAAAWKLPANASSVHGFGRDARKLLDDARAAIAKTLDAEGAHIIFTASGTEANNFALRGFVKDIDNVAVSSVEHVSVLKPAEERDAMLIPVNADGVMETRTLEQLLDAMEGRTLVSIQLANNETGVIQPVKDLAQVVFRHGGYIHCDASQAVGKIAVSFNNLGVDMLTISAHKFGGPVGAAALIIKKGMVLEAQMLGGGQESGYRAGTENIPAIAGMAAALEALSLTQPNLRDYLEQEILATAPNATIFGRNAPRLPNTVCVALPGMNSETQLINFDLAGVAVSSGSACSSGKVSLSHVLLAMGVQKELAGCAIRISLGRESSETDVKTFLDIFKKNAGKTIYNREAA